MKAPGVTIKRIHKYFYSISRGKIVALRDVTFNIEEGEFFVILGPSGCGKSTLLNIIAGLEKQNSGEIWFGKDCVSSAERKYYQSPKQRNIAMVFQSYALYPHMTVFDNIAFPLKVAKTKKIEIERRVQEVARTLSITHLLETKPRELSGGQRQRAAMARAIVRHPNLFLLDEPLSNIDAKLRVRMRSELKGLQRMLQVTTIYVTHDQVEAMTLGDRIAVLQDGEVQQVGKPLHVYNNPANIFVAGFLGTPPMNLLDAKVLEKDGKLCIMIDTMELRVPDEKVELLKILKESTITLGIRPEDVNITSDTTSREVVKKMKLIEHLGNELLIHVQITNQEIVAKVSEARDFKEGEDVGIVLNVNKILFFGNNGKNIEENYGT